MIRVDLKVSKGIHGICEGNETYVVIISWNSHIPSRDAATPRTAEETMCVIGEVTLMESRLAIFIRNPRRPYIYQAM